jgi:hypothetical protein
MIRLPLVLVLAMLPSAQQTPEPKKIPKDSVEVVATGCLTGRAFTATPPNEIQQPEPTHGPNIVGRTYRVAGKKDVMKDVKAHNGHLVQVVGIVRTASLSDNGPGRRIGNTRVVIGSPGGSDPIANPSRAPVANVPVMDLESVRYLSSECPIGGR